MRKANRKVFKESNTNVTWYEQLWDYISGNPSNADDLIANSDRTGVIKYFILNILPFLSPMILAVPCAGTWNKIKNYYNADNRNIEKTLDLASNLVATASSITIFALFWAGLTYVAPYVLIGALGVGFSYAFYNIVKHTTRAVRAYYADDKERAMENVSAIPRQLLTMVVTALGFVTHLSYAFNLFQISSAWELIKNATFSTQISASMIYIVGSVITLVTLPSLVSKALQLNNDTVEVLSHPQRSLNNFTNKIVDNIDKGLQFAWNNPVKAIALAVPTALVIAAETLSTAVGFMSRIVAALVIGPFQLLNYGINTLFSSKREVVKTLDAPVKADGQAFSTYHLLVSMKNELDIEVDAEIKHLESVVATNPNDRKHLAKLLYVRQVKDKFSDDENNNGISLEKAEADCKEISSSLFQSFWSETGRVEKIKHDAKAFEQALRSASPSLSAQK